MKSIIIFISILSSIFMIQSCNIDTSTNKKNGEDGESLNIDIDIDEEKLNEGISGALKGLEGLGDQLSNALAEKDADGNAKIKEPVNFRDMKEVLPTRYNRSALSDTEGETTGIKGFTISKVSGKYINDDEEFKVQIVDGGGMALAKLGAAAWSNVKIDKETSTMSERTYEYKGQKTYEKVYKKTGRSVVTVLHEDRFVITIEGENVDLDDLYDLYEDIDLRKLGKLAE